MASDEMARIGLARPVLVVIPVLEGPWATTGYAAYAMATPGSVKTGIPGEDKAVGRIAWSGNATHGTATVDGRPVAVPYHWKIIDEGDQWQVDAVLRKGPDTIHTFQPGPCM